MNRIVSSLVLGLAVCLLNGTSLAGPVVRFDTGVTGTNAIPPGLSLVGGDSYTFYLRLSGFPPAGPLSAYGLVIKLVGSNGMFDFQNGDFGFLAPTSTAAADFAANGFGVFPGSFSGNSYVFAPESGYTSFSGVANLDTGTTSNEGRLALSDILLSGGVNVTDDTNDLLAKVTLWTKASYSGTLTLSFSSEQDDILFLDPSGEDYVVTTGDAVTFSVTPIPEPSSMVLAGLAFGCVALVRVARSIRRSSVN